MTLVSETSLISSNSGTLYHRPTVYVLPESSLLAVVITHWLHATPPAESPIVFFPRNKSLTHWSNVASGCHVPSASCGQHATIDQFPFHAEIRIR
jgi:hypothetical protein